MNKKESFEQKKYKSIQEACAIVKIACFAYSFMCLLYWFFTTTGLKLLNGLSFMFEPIFNIVRNFYVQKTVAIEKADLAGIVAGLIFVGVAILAHVIKDYAEKKEELARVEQLQRLKALDMQEQKRIEMEYLREMKKYDKFIILVDFHLQKIKSYLFSDDNTKEEDLNELKIKLMTELFNKVNDKYIIQKANYLQRGFYIIGSIESAPVCITNITKIIKEFARTYSEMNISVYHDLSFDVISSESNIDEKLELLQKILQLNYTNATLTTSLFKTCFELISKKTLNFSVLGKYQFFIGGKSINYELYDVKIV